MDKRPTNSGEPSAAHAANPAFIELMARMPELQPLKREELADFARLESRIFQSGEVIISGEHHSHTALVVLLAGVCDVLKTAPLGGGQTWVVVSKLHAPTVFGEVGMFASRHWTATVVAASKVVALMIPKDIVMDVFERSKNATEGIVIGFVRLGIARCARTTGSYIALSEEIFGRDVIDAPRLWGDIDALESDVEAALEVGSLDDRIFNRIGDKLEWLDSAMALATLFKLQPDAPPVNDSAALPPLARQAAREGAGGGSVKRRLIDLCLERNGGRFECATHIPCLEEMTAAMDEVAAAQAGYPGEEAGDEPPTMETILGEFCASMRIELDRIGERAISRFGLDRMPSPAENSGFDNEPEFVSFLSEELEAMKLRLPEESAIRKKLEVAGALKGELKMNLGLAVFTRIGHHPLIRYLVSAYRRGLDDTESHRALDGVPLMSGFFCADAGRTAPKPDKARI